MSDDGAIGTIFSGAGTPTRCECACGLMLSCVRVETVSHVCSAPGTTDVDVRNTVFSMERIQHNTRVVYFWSVRANLSSVIVLWGPRLVASRFHRRSHARLFCSRIFLSIVAGSVAGIFGITGVRFKRCGPDRTCPRHHPCVKPKAVRCDGSSSAFSATLRYRPSCPSPR
jgi:hypothetical protein